MLTHARINARFAALDQESAMLSTVFDGWLAWPIVKERLWLACLAAAAGGSGRPARSMLTAVRRLSSGLLQVADATLRPGRAPVALLYDRRAVRLPDGTEVHPHLGRYAASDGCPRLHYLYSWGGHQRGDPATRRTLRDHDVGAVTAAVARVARRAADVARATALMAPTVASACPEIASGTVSALVADQLARFRCRHRLFRRLYRRRQVRAVVVLDPDGKVAEVAAAKALGLPVIEVQHGMFGTGEPDYSWTDVHRRAAAPMPVADRVVVFGPLWREALAQAGYWGPDAIHVAASPVVGPYRQARVAGYRPPQPGAPLRLLFASQGYVRSHAIGFWRAALGLQAARPRFALRIKVHPMEIADREAYDALAVEFPAACSVVVGVEETYPEMLRADIVAGYTSLMLLEALGMGVPTLGIRGGAAAEGFAASFGLPALAAAIDEVASPEALLDRLAAADPPHLAAWSARMAAASGSVFDLEGPPVETVLATLIARPN